ncbi:hypothetical protein CDAR_492311 [Caerostris darwini]|uniref:Uncharacterized protein n=1 Tax=Caerostris darwini TaxID=1538125 RepID=A0AAV4UYV3_9ARAC|nr:hypothetical protein CDAR_492311 [Caerostris darwini]
MSKDQTGPPRRVMLSASISSSRTPVSYQKRQRAETKARYAPLQYQLSPTTELKSCVDLQYTMLKRRITIRSYTWLISLPLPIVTDLIIASPAHSSKHSVAIRMGWGMENSDVEVPLLFFWPCIFCHTSPMSRKQYGGGCQPDFCSFLSSSY